MNKDLLQCNDLARYLAIQCNTEMASSIGIKNSSVSVKSWFQVSIVMFYMIKSDGWYRNLLQLCNYRLRDE